MRLGISHGLHASPWRDPRPGAHVARAAKFILLSQVEAGVGCPISMTYSVIPAIRKQPELAEEWEPRFTSLSYDGERLVPAPDKKGALCGMAMTEKQGGSDVRANTTVADAAERRRRRAPSTRSPATSGSARRPMCDAFLVLAQAEGGLSCFLLPRFTPTASATASTSSGSRTSSATARTPRARSSSAGAWARLVGEEGRGVPDDHRDGQPHPARLRDRGQRRLPLGNGEAIHHASHRSAFGKPLVDQPLMQNVLADLAIESEAATIGAMWLARAFDEAHAGDEHAIELRRLATPVLKYWICKRAPVHAVEALECLGGNGYVEESGMPRLFRESPLASIWEGSGNVQCLDVLRAMARNPQARRGVLRRGRRGGRRRAAARRVRLAGFATTCSDPETIETRARGVVERMALALQASLLVRYGDPAVADAFCASRLAGDSGRAFGTLPAGTDFGRIIERHARRAV